MNAMILLIYPAISLIVGSPAVEPSWLSKLWTDPVATFTAALFVATIFLAVVTGILVRATYKLYEGAELAAERQQRAYVVPYLVLMAAGNGFVIHIKNFGQTPAKRVRLWGGYKLSNDVTRADIDALQAGDAAESAAVVSPGTETEGFVPIDVVEHGALLYYLFGVVEYVDIFKKTRHSPFCFKASSGDKGWAFQPMADLTDFD